ncbi:MAG: hypothetical protein K0Q71_6258 [Thermomicrobiales bacterium]|nr:hypothetical protein [Thermomicrobiales bacterium]
MVPPVGRSKTLAPATKEVLAHPPINAARAARYGSWARRNPKSATSRPAAASTRRAAFVAISVETRPEQPRFQKQRLAEGRRHAQQRLVGEGDGPLRHSQDLAREPEMAQLVEERRIVGFDPGQVGEIPLRVPEVSDEGQRRLQTRGQEIGSPERRGTGVEVERRRRVLTRPPADISGVEVIEIDEETGGCLRFVGPHRPQDRRRDGQTARRPEESEVGGRKSEVGQDE